MTMFAPTIRRIKKVDEITLIDLIAWVSTIQTIVEILNVERVGSIDLIKVIANMPNLTMYGSEGVAFRQTDAGEGAWIVPTGFEENEDWTIDEIIYSPYDEDTDTCARNQPGPYAWGSFLVLEITELPYNKIRFWAKPAYGGTPPTYNKIDVDVLRDGIWVDVYEGEFIHDEWTDKAFGEGRVTKIRFRFYNAQPGDVWMNLCEVALWRVPSTGGEMIAVLYAWDGSAYKKVRCDTDGFLLTKAG